MRKGKVARVTQEAPAKIGNEKEYEELKGNIINKDTDGKDKNIRHLRKIKTQ